MNSDQSSRGPHEPTLAYYEANAQSFFQNTHSVDMSSIYEPFLTLLPSRAHILDAGCGSGRDSLAFLKRGYEVTAMDASESMVKLASCHTGRPVLHMSLDQLRFQDRFDGVWACASLLHVPKHGLPMLLKQLSLALKADGVMYASFKYGEEEVVRDGRLFSDYSENSLQGVIDTLPELELLKLWQTTDLRLRCNDTTWLNVLLRKRPLQSRRAPYYLSSRFEMEPRWSVSSTGFTRLSRQRASYFRRLWKSNRNLMKSVKQNR